MVQDDAYLCVVVNVEMDVGVDVGEGVVEGVCGTWCVWVLIAWVCVSKIWGKVNNWEDKKQRKNLDGTKKKRWEKGVKTTIMNGWMDNTFGVHPTRTYNPQGPCHQPTRKKMFAQLHVGTNITTTWETKNNNPVRAYFLSSYMQSNPCRILAGTRSLPLSLSLTKDHPWPWVLDLSFFRHFCISLDPMGAISICNWVRLKGRSPGPVLSYRKEMSRQFVYESNTNTRNTPCAFGLSLQIPTVKLQ